MHDTLKGLYFFTRFAYPFSALGYRQQRLFWKAKPNNFERQRWLITGASGGIGRAIAEGAAAGGAGVDAAARSEAKLSQLVEDAGENVIPRAADLSVTADVEALLDRLAKTHGATNDAVSYTHLRAHETRAFIYYSV